MVREAGAEVIGPAESLPQAIRMMQNCEALDCALLDILLEDIAVFPLATQLRASNIPMLFVTGVGCGTVPEEFVDVRCITKPASAVHVIEELNALFGPLPADA